MTNFDVAEQALKTSQESAGSAMSEHEKWMQSLEAKINQLKAAWQGLSQAFMNSDFLKGLLDGVIDLVQGLEKLIDTFGTLPTLLGAFGMGKAMFGKNGGFFSFDKDTKQFQIFGKSLDQVKGRFSDLLKTSSVYRSETARAATVQSLYGKNVAESSLYMGSFGTKMKNTGKVAAGVGKEFAKTTAKTLGAKAATVGLSVASTALSGVMSMGIGLAISLVIAGITKLINAKKELSQHVDEVTSKYKEQHEELMKNKADFDSSNETSAVSRYAELSKGVNSLGENVSLTSSEYEEYLEVTNKIAASVPSLVAGYDAQGNAILNTKGNVEELVAAYEKLIQQQNNEILDKESGDIEKDFKNKIDDFKIDKPFEEGLTTDVAKGLEEMLNNAYNEKEIGKYLNDNFASTLGNVRSQIREALEDAGVDVGINPDEALAETIKNNPEKIRGIVDNFKADFDEASEDMKTIAQAALSNAFDISTSDYAGISKEMQNIIRSIVNSFDGEFYAGLSEKGISIESYITDILDEFKALDESGQSKKLEAVFDLQTKFNNGDVSYGEYVKQIREAESLIDGLNLDEEVKNQIKLSLNTEEITAEYDSLITRLTETNKEKIAGGNVIGLSKEDAKKFLDGLSSEEFSVAMDVITDPNFVIDENATSDEIRKAIQSAIDLELALNGIVDIDISVEKTGIESLNTALEESRSAIGLTSESISNLEGRYKELDGYNASALFEKTANGIHLNNEELRKLEAQYANTNMLNIDSSLNTVIAKYKELTEQINNCSNEQEKESLQAEADMYADRIEELSTLASQYEGLTSAFNEWQNAQSNAEEGDNYDSLYDNLEGIKELYDKGLVGTDKFRTAVQLMSSEDLSTAGVDELVSAYEKGFPKMQRYFTEGSSGCQNFLKDVSNLNSEWAHMNKDGSWEINFGVGNDQEVADALGINVDSVQQILRKLKDYGFEIEIDSDYTSLDKLQTKVEETESRLRELNQEPVDINVDIKADSENIKTIESEIEKAKSKISEINNSSVEPDVKTAQLEDAQAKLEVLIDKKIEAEQPSFMTLNTSQVSASLTDALQKIQNYQTALNQLNKLSELKEAGIKVDDSQVTLAQQKIDECAEAIQGLDGDVKVSLGLEKDGSIDSIKEAFENGKVSIDTDTKPAVTKVEQLAENVDKIEDKDVTITVNVKGLKEVKELNKNIDIATNIDGDIDKFSEYVDGAKSLSKLGNNIVSYVTADVKGNVVETPEYKINNLKTFADSTKDLKNIGSLTARVTADIKGNVTDEFEYKIDNLKVFSDNAKDLRNIGVLESKVTANIEGNVVDEFEYKIDNLKVFSDNAKDLRNIGSFDSEVTANVKGNVTDEFEYKIDNLKVFADNAKALKGINTIKSEVTANVKGNVTDEFEYKIDNLKVFADNAKGLKSLGSFDSEITANIKGNVTDKFEYKIDNLKVFANSIKGLKGIGDITSNVTANINGNVADKFEYKINNLKVFADNARGLKSVGNITSNVVANIDGNVTDKFEYKIDNLKVFADNAKSLKNVGDITSNVEANIKGNVADKFEYKIDNLKVFSDSVKGLKNVGDITSNVEANISGNVIDTREGKIDNLKVFADSAKNVEQIGSVTSSVKANISGNVIESSEDEINNLKVFVKGAEALQGAKSNDITITANIDGNVTDEFEYKIDNLKVFAEGAKNLKGVKSNDVDITVNLEGNLDNNKNIDNLAQFAKGAKELKGIKSSEVTITANIKGNVSDTREYKIDNLKVFAEGAKNLKGIGNVTSSVTADINGNVADTREYKIDNLKVFSDSAKNVEQIGNVTSSVEANVSGNVVDTREGKIDNLKVFADNAKSLKGVGDVTSSVKANISGNVSDTREGKIDNLKVFADGARALQNVKSSSVTVDAYLNSNLTWNGSIDKLSQFAKNAKELQNVKSSSVTVNANVGGNVTDGVISRLEDFNAIVTAMSSTSSVSVNVKANVNVGAINNAITLLQKVSSSGLFKNYNATIKVATSVDSTAVDNYQPAKKNGKVKYEVDSSVVDKWKAPPKTGKITYTPTVEALTDSQKNKTGTITYKAKIEGGSPAAGTANTNGAAFSKGSSGRAFVRGDWGIKGSGVALGGELGREIVVRDGKFFTIGDEGAEFFHYKKNDIVFNASQTESLLKYGGIKGANPRGKMLASGTAFIEGTAFSKGKGTFTKPSSSSSTSSKSSKSSKTSSTRRDTDEANSKSTSKDFKETFDWIEIIISRIERQIDRLDTRVNRTYRSWSNRNGYLKDEISKVSKEINLQEKAYNKYLKKAASVGLKAKWRKKVKDGTINISTIKDEKLAEKIKEYQEWYEKALACKDAILELEDTEMELYKTSFDNIVEKYDAYLSLIEHNKSMLEEYISQSEEKGYITSTKYYDALKEKERKRINDLKAENKELIAARKEFVKAGGSTDSKDYYDMTQQINDNTLAIEEGTTALIKYNNAIRDIEWQVFDLIQERISNISEEANFLIDLMSNDKLYDDNGQLTNEGMATMGLHGQNYNTYMAQADNYAKEIDRLNKEITKDPYNQDLINRRNELIEAQQDSIKAAEDEKQAIKDMVSEGIELELDALQERIDKYNESIDAAKDLYDYQKKVKEQTKEIANIEKEIAAYQGDTSEEAKQKIQELKVSLEDAKDELKETEYDKYISDQEKLLDNLYDEYEEILNQRLDNIDALLEDMISEVNNNAETIKTTLEDKSDSVGYTISEEMKSIWNTGSGNIKSVLTTYGDNFSSKLTTLNNTLNNIKIDVDKMIAALNKEATSKISPSSSSNKSSSSSKPSSSSSKPNTSTKTSAKTIKVGGKIKATGAKIYDYKGDKTGATQYYKKDPIYKVLAISGDWIKARYHKLTKGTTGWFKKKDVKAYKTGTKAIKEQMMAWTQENGGREFIVRKSDGAILTPLAKNDSVLNANASNNIWDMANDPSKFIKNNLDLNVGSVPNNINVENSYTQNLDKVVFSFPNVKNYDEMLTQMQKDKNFEKLVLSMSIDQIAGKSKLAKNKVIR